MKKLSETKKMKLKGGVGFSFIMGIVSFITVVSSMIPVFVDLFHKPEPPKPKPKPKNKNQLVKSLADMGNENQITSW